LNKILVSVIVCTYNREQYIERNLDSLSRQSLSVENYEVIIIINNSTDNTVATCKSFIESHPELQIKYFNESNLGLSFARNRGIQESKGEIISFIDDDAFVNYDFTKNLIDFFFPISGSISHRWKNYTHL